MASSYPPKHPAVVIVKPRTPLEIIEVDTVAPSDGEILVHVEWIASTPLNLHNADGGLLITPPYIMSGCYAGTVVQVGNPLPPSQSPSSRNLEVGDKVFGFTWSQQTQRPMQEYITIPAYLAARVPSNITLQEAVTVPSNFCTVVHTITKDLELDLPWPIPKDWESSSSSSSANTARDKPILVWGAASSVGQYALQVLRLWGYRNVLAVARRKHHDSLKALGATVTFDYGDEDVVDQILSSSSSNSKEEDANKKTATIPYIIDCIGSLEGTLTPLSKIAGDGTRVAVMLPVILSHASDTEAPEYAMDVKEVTQVQWNTGVELRGVRTHFYPDNEFFKYHLQPDIMPELLEKGVIKPNKQRVVEGKTLLERAEKALDLLRQRDVSGEKLVWRVAEE